MKYAALCCIAKDEDIFLKEWLAYHSLIGFEHFVIYDNNSRLPIRTLLQGFAGPDRLTVERSDTERTQRVAYAHCLETFGRRFKWIAFLDLDEFIRISPGRCGSGDMRELLAAYEPYAALGLNWRFFSSSGHERRPDGPVIENYTRWYRDDVHIKSCVQPQKTAGCAGHPHSFHSRPGEHAVSMDFFPIPDAFPACLPATRDACVNHYYFKSRECFRFKIAKGNPCNIARRMEEFDEHLALPAKTDDALAPFAGRVREALAADRLPLPQAPETLVTTCHENLEEPPQSLPEKLFPEALHPDGTRSHAPRAEAQGVGMAAAALAAARDHLKSGRLPQASLCLCQAALYRQEEVASPDGTVPDCLTDLEIWTLRAAIARKSGHYDRAEYFLRRAFRHGASVQAHSELANVMLRTGRPDEAQALIAIVRGFNSL
jgi:hypothetical protein